MVLCLDDYLDLAKKVLSERIYDRYPYYEDYAQGALYFGTLSGLIEYTFLLGSRDNIYDDDFVPSQEDFYNLRHLPVARVKRAIKEEIFEDNYDFFPIQLMYAIADKFNRRMGSVIKNTDFSEDEKESIKIAYKELIDQKDGEIVEYPPTVTAQEGFYNNLFETFVDRLSEGYINTCIDSWFTENNFTLEVIDQARRSVLARYHEEKDIEDVDIDSQEEDYDEGFDELDEALNKGLKVCIRK